MRNNKLFVIIFMFVAAAFILGIADLFHIRFQSGDIYPVYSSLRADPLGTKVMFEGLNQIHGVSAVRNYRPLHKIEHISETTHFFFGMHTKNFNTFTQKDAERLESLLADGGRIVMTFVPGSKPGTKCITRKKESCDPIPENEQDHADKNEKIHEKADSDPDTGGPAAYIDLAQQWGVALEFHDASAASDGGASIASVLTAYSHNLPDTITWHSQYYFRIIDNGWNAVYAVKGRPVLIERDFMYGKIILSTDTYFASNEAMLKERHPDLLSWIIGKNRRVLFDETHLGIVEQPNLASLARKYRLHGLFAGVLFLAALLIWKNSTSFIPPDKDHAEEDVQKNSKDHLSGLVNLLRRNIRSGDIVNACFHEWAKSAGQRYGAVNDLNQIKIIIEQDRKTPVGKRNSLKSYNSIRQIFDKRRSL
ncbi:MAG: hypothetical protein AMK71_03325 [Nitrospira bacterium SG8_35_4]|nr:MAG: hypothetical protein AMK71_03325 [Nitrospira bacterium SG8_35_4]